MPAGRRFEYDDDDDDEPRARPSTRKRSRRGREPRGLSGGAWAGIICGGLLVVVVVAVFLARKVGSGGLADGPPIDAEAFKRISKHDTIESLTSRYGRPKRLSDADLERIGFTGPSRVDRRVRVRKSFKQSIAEFGVTNPEVYHWQWATTDLYIVLKPNDPKQNLLLKVFISSGPDANGNTHNQMDFADFGDEKD